MAGDSFSKGESFLYSVYGPELGTKKEGNRGDHAFSIVVVAKANYLSFLGDATKGASIFKVSFLLLAIPYPIRCPLPLYAHDELILPQNTLAIHGKPLHNNVLILLYRPVAHNVIP